MISNLLANTKAAYICSYFKLSQWGDKRCIEDILSGSAYLVSAIHMSYFLIHAINLHRLSNIIIIFFNLTKLCFVRFMNRYWSLYIIKFTWEWLGTISLRMHLGADHQSLFSGVCSLLILKSGKKSTAFLATEFALLQEIWCSIFHVK